MRFWRKKWNMTWPREKESGRAKNTNHWLAFISSLIQEWSGATDKSGGLSFTTFKLQIHANKCNNSRNSLVFKSCSRSSGVSLKLRLCNKSIILSFTLDYHSVHPVFISSNLLITIHSILLRPWIVIYSCSLLQLAESLSPVTLSRFSHNCTWAMYLWPSSPC